MNAGKTALRGELGAFQKRLGYCFTDVTRLERALDLRKVSSVEGRGYDRFEKWGDRLLYPIVLDMIESAYPEAPLCELTRMERVLTTNQNLAHLAIRLDLMSVLVHRYPDFIYVEKTLADIFEAISAAIAKDAGGGDALAGMPALRRVCKKLFSVDLTLAQIDQPFPFFVNQAHRRWNLKVKHEWKQIHFGRQPIGYTCKLYVRGKAAQAFGLPQKKSSFIAGTGVTTEQALRKAAGLALVKLMPQKFPNALPPVRDFSWRIKAR